MEVDRAFDLIADEISRGVSRGYLVIGDTAGNCRELVQRVLGRLFPDEPEKVAAGIHPDVAWLEPEGRSGTIKVETMREKIVEPMSVTAYSGGWKAAVIVGADRMQQTAANAFLKTLEEPPRRTVLMLLTDNPDALLPTIISRCQRIDLKLPPGILEGEAYEAVAEVMEAKGIEGTFAKGAAARRLAEILEGLKTAAEDAEIAAVRKLFYRTLLHFVRRQIETGTVSRHLAFRNVQLVEDAYRRSDRSMNDEMVLSLMTDLMTFG